MYGKFCLYGFLKNLKFFDPFLILFFREAGLSFLEIGTLFSIREISTNILEIPSGIAADIVGRRSSMVFSFIAYMLSFLVFYFFPSFLPAIAAMIVFSVGEAFRTGTHKAMILTYLEINNMTDKKVQYYGKTRSWSEIGSAVSAIIAAFIVFYTASYRYVFLFSLIPYLAGLILLISYPKYLDGVQEKTMGSAREIFGEFLRMIRQKEVLKPMLKFSIFHGSFKSIKDYIQPVILALALSVPLFADLGVEKRASVFAGSVYFVLYILTSIAARNAHRLTKGDSNISIRLNILYIISALVMVAIGLLVKIPVLIIICFILYYLLMNMIRPMQLGLMGNLIKSRVYASGLSVESQSTSIMTAIIAPLFGFLVDTFSLQVAFIGTGLFLAVLFLLLPVRERKTDS
ncbi:MAG: MFS transporter [Spirochaetales bacterium]|nr:MFS transporter [Spirochaetales bacterium]